jgi:hypothetical protein
VNGVEGQERLAVLETTVEQLRDEVSQLNASTKALVDAWNTATGVVKFVKLMSTMIAAMGAVWLFIRHGFKAGV